MIIAFAIVATILFILAAIFSRPSLAAILGYSGLAFLASTQWIGKFV
jgi:hypothetical protein